MINEQINVTGNLEVVLRDASGAVKETRSIPNLVVTVGKNYIASRMKDATASVMSHMAVGTNSTSPIAGDTTLGTELTRAALTSTTVSTNTVAYAATYAAGIGTGALVESGLFNAGTAGTMLARTTYAVINKGASDSLAITWTITVG